MPRNSFPAANRHSDDPIVITDINPISKADFPLPTIQERTLWRPVGTGIASLGIPAGIGMLHPVLGEALIVIEIVLVLTIIGTALFGSPVLSERAFRLLRWLGNRPEPPKPTADSPADAPGGADPSYQG